MCSQCNLRPDDLVIPAALPLGGFRPLMCCVCGVLLRQVKYKFQEGTVCALCYGSLPEPARRMWREWGNEPESTGKGGGK